MTTISTDLLDHVTGGNAVVGNVPRTSEWGVPWTGPRIRLPQTGPDPRIAIGVPARPANVSDR